MSVTLRVWSASEVKSMVVLPQGSNGDLFSLVKDELGPELSHDSVRGWQDSSNEASMAALSCRSSSASTILSFERKSEF